VLLLRMTIMSTDLADEHRHDEVARYVVRVRRMADLSQRDLAALVGVSPSTVGRYETNVAAPPLRLFEEILAVAGLRLAVVDRDANEVLPVPVDSVRDNQGRRFPAHLDVVPPDEVPFERWAFPRYDRPQARGWFRHRAARDELAEATPHRERPTDHPTEPALALRRRLMGGRQPRVDAPPVADVECECLDACFEELCIAECPCQCEPPRYRHRRRVAFPVETDEGRAGTKSPGARKP
jgi:transcriptional regulator with XRE-family HTH domain